MATKQKGKPAKPAKPRSTKPAKPAASKAKPAKAKPAQAKAAKPKPAAKPPAAKKVQPKPQPKPKAPKAPPAKAAAAKAVPARSAPPARPAPPPARPTGTAGTAPASHPQATSASGTLSSAPLSSGLSKSTTTLSAASPIDGVRYLSVQDVVDLHKAVSTEFGGNQARPGVVESQFGLLNAVQRPQITTLGREAYPQFADKVAAFVFALLQARPFQGGNRRVALASIFAFAELNNRSVDSRVLDEKTAETVIKRAAGHREMGLLPENVYAELREVMRRAIG